MTHDGWAVGDPYDGYMGRWSRRVAAAFLDWLEDPPAGLRWLDVGCGTGALTATVLAVADPAEVVGVDPSEGFLATARAQRRPAGHVPARRRPRARAARRRVRRRRQRAGAELRPGANAGEGTEYHSLVAWDRLAEVCGQFLGKGQLVDVEGQQIDRLLPCSLEHVRRRAVRAVTR